MVGIHMLNQAPPGRFLGHAPRSLVTTPTGLIRLLSKPKSPNNYKTTVLIFR